MKKLMKFCLIVLLVFISGCEEPGGTDVKEYGVLGDIDDKSLSKQEKMSIVLNLTRQENDSPYYPNTSDKLGKTQISGGLGSVEEYRTALEMIGIDESLLKAEEFIYIRQLSIFRSDTSEDYVAVIFSIYDFTEEKLRWRTIATTDIVDVHEVYVWDFVSSRDLSDVATRGSIPYSK